MTRDPGFYWVKFRGSDWFPAEWKWGKWFYGNESLENDQPHEVGPFIVPPPPPIRIHPS
jgi:hypothetical protein